MSETLRFQVRGTPVPQGSSRAFVARGRAHITSDNPNLSSWRHAIAAAAGTAMGEQPVRQGACTVRVLFVLGKPKSAPKRAIAPTTRPDLDKLVRALLDGCTGVVWRDDSQVTTLWAAKSYGDVVGAHVTIEDEHEFPEP